MEALTLKAALVDQDPGDEAAVTTAIPRSEIEDALREEESPADLFLDTTRSRAGGEEATRRIILSWEPDDLDRLLATQADPVTLAFRPDELNRIFEEPDVEAQGLRQRAAILTVAAVTVAGAAAGAANAQVAVGDGGGSPTSIAGSAVAASTSTLESAAASELEQPGGARFATHPATPTEAPAAAPAEQVKPAGDGGDFLGSAGGAATLAGGITLLIAAAGFASTRHHRTKARPA